MAYNLNFDPARFRNLALGDSPEADSLPLTSDRFVTREELEEARRERLPEGIEPDSFIVDADTISVPGYEKNLRLSGINAWETSDNPQVQRQREILARKLGKHPDDITLADIKELGFRARGKAEELFADGAYITQVDTDPYGRPVVSAHTPDGRDISEELNNPFLNASYGTKYNRAHRMRKALEQQNTEKWARRQGIVTTGYNAETGEPEIQQNPVTGEFHIGRNTYGSLELAEKFAPLVIAEHESSKSWKGGAQQLAARGVAGAQQLWADLAERNYLLVKYGAETNFDEKVQTYNSIQPHGQRFEDPGYRITDGELEQYKLIKTKNQNALNKADLAFLNSEKGRALASLDEEFVKQEAAYKLQEHKEADRAAKVNRVGDVSRSMTFNSIAEKRGIVDALKFSFHPDNLIASTGQMVESLPFMALLAATPYVSVPGMAALYTSTLQKNKREFAKLNNGRSPEGEKRDALYMGTAYQILGEKAGADILFKGFPGAKLAFSKFVTSRLPGMMFRPLSTGRTVAEMVVGEGSSGAITTFGEMYAQGQEIDPIAIWEGAAQEATGAIGMRGGISGARTARNIIQRRKIAFTDEQLDATVRVAAHHKKQAESGKLNADQQVRVEEKLERAADQLFGLWQKAIDKGDNKGAVKARDHLIEIAPIKYLEQRKATLTEVQNSINEQGKKYAELTEKETAGEDVSKEQLDIGLTLIGSAESLVRLREDLKSAAQKVAEKSPEDAAALESQAEIVGKEFTQVRGILDVVAADNANLQRALVQAEKTKRLFSIDFEGTKKNDIDVDELSAQEKSFYEAHEDLRSERKTLLRRSSTQRDKSLEHVDDDITGGTGAYLGADQHLARAKQGLFLTDSKMADAWKRFSKGIKDKAKAFKNAQKKFQKTGKTVYIDKSTLDFVEEGTPGISSDTHWFVDKRSNRLVQALQNNAAYIAKQDQLINQANKILAPQIQAMNMSPEDIARTQQLAQGIQVLDAVEAVINPKEEGSLEDIAKPVKSAESAEAAEPAEPATRTPAKKPKKTEPSETKKASEKKAEKEAAATEETVEETEVAEKVEAVPETVSLLDRLKDRLLPIKSKYVKDRSEIFKSSSTKQGTMFPVLSQRLKEEKPLTEKELTQLITDVLKQQLGDNASVADQASVQKQAQLLSKTFATFKRLLNANPQFISQDESQVAASNISMLYVKDANGNVTLPDEYVMAASIALLSWIKSDGKKSLNMPESAISSMLFGKDHYRIPKQIQSQLRNFGVPVNIAAQSIGSDISAALGIRVPQIEGDPDRNNVVNQEKFASSLGLMALDLASHPDIAENDRLLVPRQSIEVKLDKADFANQDIEDAEFNETFFGEDYNLHNTTKIPFSPKLDPKGRAVPSKRLDSAIEILRDKANLDNGKPFGLDQVFAELAGVQFAPNDYHTKPVKGTQETARNSIYPVSPDNKKAQEVAQSTPWRPILEFMDAYSLFTQDLKEIFYGVQSTAELLTQQVAGVESANSDKYNDIEVLDNLKDDEIYFRYGVMNQERMYIKSSTLNPQSSKLHRFAIAAADTETISTPEERNAFKLAVLQSFGMDIDKQSGASSLRGSAKVSFDGILNDQIVKDALEAYQNKDVDTFNDKMLELYEKYEPDHGYHMLLGLVSLASYDETSPFDTNMVMEIDAVTSGYAISILQFLGSDTQKTLEDLRRTGTFAETDDDNFNSYLDKGFPDTYQLIGKIVGEFFRGDFDLTEQGKKINNSVRSAISALQPNFFDAVSKLDKFARKVAKNPFMIFIYAAGLKSISRAVAKERLANIIQDIGTLQSKWKAAKNANAKQRLEDDLQAIEDNLRKLGMTQGNLVGRLKDGSLSAFEFSWKEEKTINRNIADVYYQAFDLAMPIVLEGVIERRDILNAAVEAWYFAYQEKAESWLKENYPQAKEYHYTHWLEAQKALAEQGIHFAIDGVNSEGPMTGKISLFKQESDFDNKGKVENRHGKDSITTRVIRIDGKGKPQDMGSSKSARSTTKPYRYKFAAPGVSGNVKGVQNIDSGQFTTGFLAVDGKMVPLYDAGISTPSVMDKAARKMSDRFLEAGFNHSIIDQVYEGLKNTLTSMTPKQVERAKARHLAEGRKTKDKKKPDIQDRYDAIRNLSTVMKTEREALKEALGEAKVDHYFMPSIEDTEAPVERPSIVKDMQGTIPPKNARESLIGWLDRILSTKPDTVSDQLWARANDTTSIDGVVQLEIDGQADTSLLQAALIRQAMENVGNRNGRYVINQLVRDLATISNIPVMATTQTAKALQSLVDQLAAKETGKKPDYQSINVDVDLQMEHVFEHSDAAVVGERIFDKLVEKDLPNMDEQGKKHIDHLRKVNKITLSAVSALSGVKVTINRILDKGQFSFGYADVTGNRQIVINQSSYTPRTYAEQTDAEIEVHEKVHIVTEAALTDPVYKDLVRKLRTEAKNHITWRDFLARDAQGNILVRNNIKEEIRQAKLMYNSVFGPGVAGNQALAEFIAYGMTNRHLVGRLNQIQVPKEKFFAGDTLFEKILSAFAKATSIFRGMAPKANANQTIYQALEKATVQIIQANESKRDAVRATLLDRQTQKFRDDMNAKIIKMGTKIFKKVGDKLAKERDPNKPVNLRFRDPKNAFQAIISAVGIGFTELPYIIQNEPRAMEALSRAADLTYRRNPFLNESVNMIKRLGKQIPTAFHRFADLRNKRIDVARKEMEELQVEMLKGAFHNPELVEDTEVRSALTRVLLRTDISTLLEDGGYDLENIRRLMFDDEYRKAEIRQRLRSNGIKQGTWLHMQVTQLAEKLVTGKARGHVIFQNAHAIAANIPAKEQRKGITDTSDFIRELDQVITLLALDKTPVENRNQIKQVVDAEYASDSTVNGITNLVKTLRRTKMDALRENFDDNPMHMAKGYKPSEIDPFTTVKVASVAQHRQLKKEGYELVSRLPAIPGATTDEYGLFINKNAPKTTREQGLLSATTIGHAGTSVRSMIARTSAAAGTVGVEFQNLLKQEMQKSAALKIEQFETLEPIVNDKGEVTDLVMSMSHHNKETHLKDDMDIFTNIGAIARRTVDRKNTVEHNKEVVRELKRRADTERPGREWAFINIFDEQYAEYFNSLHPETKRELRLLADTEGKGKNTKFTFYVERDWLPVIFSHDRYSISGLIEKLPDSSQKQLAGVKRRIAQGEKVMEDLSSYIKSVIALRLPTVLIANLISNANYSIFHGVPVSYLAERWHLILKEFNRVSKLSQELQRTQIQIETDKRAGVDPKLAVKRDSLTQEINDSFIKPYMDRGFYSGITEDINTGRNTYRTKAFQAAGDKLQEKLYLSGKARENFHTAHKHLYLTEKSQFFKGAQHILRTSDFINKVMLHDFLTNYKGFSDDQAYGMVQRAFVNYNIALPRMLSYLESVGLLRFGKYWYGIQQANIELVKNRPLEVGAFMLFKAMSGVSVPSIFDSSVFLGSTPQLLKMGSWPTYLLEPPALRLLDLDNWTP